MFFSFAFSSKLSEFGFEILSASFSTVDSSLFASLKQHKDAVIQDHKVQSLVDSVAHDLSELGRIYDDHDGCDDSAII